VFILKPGKSCKRTVFITTHMRCGPLHRAIGALEFQDERERAKRFLPGNAGKAWSNQEDAQICEELRRGMTFEQIAQIHNRTNGSIVARLVRLGKISAGPQAQKTA
jgi:hypothetical protein